MRSRRPFRVLALVLAAALTVAACSDDADGDGAASSTTTAPRSTTSEADQADALVVAEDQLGPYSVGRRTVTLVDESRDGRELVVDAWYPTDVEDGSASTYSFAPGIEYDSEVALDSPAVSADGPFPLVVYSHGSGGQRYFSAFLTEALASQGFVVVAPDHAGNTTLDQVLGSVDDREVVASNRPEDVSFLVSSVLDGSVDPELSDAVDGSSIGVVGHSVGGYTALAVGGGVEDLAVGPDDRVGALVVMAPAAGGLSDEDLESVDVPTLVLSGTLDESTPIDPNTERVAEFVAGRPLVRVDLVGGAHQSFSDGCLYEEVLAELPDVPPAITELVDQLIGNACEPEALDVERAQDLINTYAIAFLAVELAGDEEALDVFGAEAPDEVELQVVE